MKAQTSKPYLCKDFGEATALVTVGQNLTGLEDAGGFFYFAFPNLKECEELSKRYWSGELQVCARDFASNMKMLKSRLRAGK